VAIGFEFRTRLLLRNGLITRVSRIVRIITVRRTIRHAPANRPVVAVLRTVPLIIRVKHATRVNDSDGHIIRVHLVTLLRLALFSRVATRRKLSLGILNGVIFNTANIPRLNPVHLFLLCEGRYILLHCVLLFLLGEKTAAITFTHHASINLWKHHAMEILPRRLFRPQRRRR
jgi:hypothetical protein